MSAFQNPFLFDVEKGEMYNLGVAAKFMRTTSEANEGLAKWMLSTAVPFNNPEFGIVAADQWKAHLETIISLFLTQSLELVGFAVDASMFRLTGNSKFANYYKRIDGAMRLGGDLAQLLSVSACEKYTKDIRAKIKDDGEAAAKREQLKVMAVRKGLVPDTDEFNQFVETGMGNVVKPVPTAGTTTDGPLADTEPKDEWDEFGAAIAEQLRIYSAEVSHTTARQMAESLITRLKEGVTKRLAQKHMKNSAPQPEEKTYNVV